jgi:hypothetical protein
MKQRLLALLFIAQLLPLGMWAALAVDDTFKVDGITFKVTSISPNEVQVGAGASYIAISLDTEGVVNIPSSVKDPEGKSYSVTGIGPSAFGSCKKLTEIKIPKSVTTIGSMAFDGCSGITSITLPDGLKSIGSNAFARCTSLVSVVIPKGITNVESLIFSGCTSLTTVTCKSNLGATAFNGCTALTDVTFTKDVTTIPQGAFQNCSALKSIIIPSSVTTIELQAFSGCSNLTNVTLTEGLESIGASAFAKCSSLKSIVIPSSVKEIGTSIFRQCDAITAVYVDLKSWCLVNIDYGSVGPEVWYEYLYLNNVKATEITDLIIPEGVTKLSDNVFKSWKNLKSVTFPASMTDFSSLNFEKCNSLKAVHIKDLTVWFGTKFNIIAPYYKYNPLYYAKHLFVNGAEVKDLVIPEGVSVINDDAFYGCEGLTSVTFPEGVTTIGASAFGSCTNLASVTIPKSLTYIGGGAFSSCTALNAVHVSDVAAWCAIPFLESTGSNPLKLAGHLFMNGEEVKDLVIPEGVTSISYGAFNGCKEFNSVSIPSTLTKISGFAFSGVEANTVYIKDLAAWCKIKFGDELANSSNPLYHVQHLFVDGEEVKDLVIPDGVTSISDYAFYYCEALTSVNTGNTVTSIGGYAFVGCTNITTLTIGSTVSSFGSRPFFHTVGLNEVISQISEPFEIDEYSFINNIDGTLKTPSATLYVPVGTKALYEATKGWNTFKNIVEMVNIDPIEGETTVNTESLNGQDLSDNVVDDIYYNVGDDGYDATDGSIVIGEATNMGQITNAVPGSDDVKNNFKGIILKVAKGKGTITVNVKTSGNAQLVVQVGDGTPMIASKTEKGDVVVSYDVEEDTYVYIYAILGGSAARATRASSDGEVRIYGINIKPGATGISSIVKEANSNAPFYNLSGQRLSVPRKGINIIDGKKVVIK